MVLTPTQLQTVKTAVLADPTALGYRQAGDTASMRDWLNAPSTVTVWRTEAPVAAIMDAIDWSKFTPTAPLDDVTLLDALTANRRSAQLLAIQTKQMNLQAMLFGRTSIDASRANIRAGLRDAVIALPAGNGGAAVAAGGASGAAVLAACTRLARRAEAFLVGGTATTGSTTANLLIFEGLVDGEDASWLCFN